MSNMIQKAKRVVIKIGSSLIVNQANFELRQNWLKTLACDVADLKQKGKAVIIVTSGSVALGRKNIQNSRKSLKLEEKQAAAACGQPKLMQKYQEYLGKYNIETAQILLTLYDSEHRQNYLNARNTINMLLSKEIVPIINENDTVATEELRFGDNDRLASRVAQMASADLLILFSDVDGLYTSNPSVDKSAAHIPLVKEINSDIEAMAAGAIKTGIGSGGMITKIAAAKIALNSGCNMILASGQNNNPVKNLENGGKHTLFVAKDTPKSARKRWIANSLQIAGEIVIDQGAVVALKNGKSLLAAGVVRVTGNFEQGDAVLVSDVDSNKIAIGLSAYAMQDARNIIGKNSKEIKAVTLSMGKPELIHRDDLVLK